MTEFSTMEDAVAQAIKHCDQWIIVSNGQTVGEGDALVRANEIDEGFKKSGLIRRQSFFCSDEGAVGLSDGREYMVQWIMLPLPNLDAGLEEQIRADYDISRQEPAPQKSPKFCKNCGNPISEGKKFCKNCGMKIG